MGKYLDKIMRMSGKGYIDSFDEIEKITEKVLTIDFSDLIAKGGHQVHTIANDLIDISGLPMECSDLVGISIYDMLDMAHALYFSECESPDLRTCGRYTAIMAEILNKASAFSTDIKLFLSISVKAFADFMDKKSGTDTHKCMDMYAEIADLAEEELFLDITEETTIGCLINSINPYITHWNVKITAEEFISRAENCLFIITTIFIRFINEGYKEFDSGRIREKIAEIKTAFDLEMEKLFESLDDDDLDDDFELDSDGYLTIPAHEEESRSAPEEKSDNGGECSQTSETAGISNEKNNEA